MRISASHKNSTPFQRYKIRLRPILMNSNVASSFSRRLQGDFRPSPLSALHRPAALFAGGKGLLVPFHAKMFNYRFMIPYFKGLSRQFAETRPELFRESPVRKTDLLPKRKDLVRNGEVFLVLRNVYSPVKGFSML